MPELSKKQMRLLSSIASGSMEEISKEDVSKHKDDIKYFLEHDLIQPIHRKFTEEERKEHNRMRMTILGHGPLVGYKISPKGNATLYNKNQDNKRFWIGFWVNFALAVIAIIVSVISLLESVL
ncbi:MAG: hypothetical protein KH354_06200 [Clostridiales bacterium]|nr:hypothetical protein [Clostridiales bacterium]